MLARSWQLNDRGSPDIRNARFCFIFQMKIPEVSNAWSYAIRSNPLRLNFPCNIETTVANLFGYAKKIEVLYIH